MKGGFMNQIKFREERCTPSHEELCKKSEYCISYKTRLDMDETETKRLCTCFRCPAAEREIYFANLNAGDVKPARNEEKNKRSCISYNCLV